jgi:hypothetical protein
MEFGISFGALCDPIATQLRKAKYKYCKEDVMRFEKMRDAIHWLSFSGIITDSMKDKCWQKLFKKIESHVCAQNKLKKIKK